MSPEFISILNEREVLWDDHDYVFLFGRIAIISLALVFRRKRLLIPLMLAVTDLCIARDDAMFDQWWWKLNAAAQNEEDRGWICNHDGGGLIAASLENTFRGVQNLLLGFCIIAIRSILRIGQVWIKALKAAGSPT